MAFMQVYRLKGASGKVANQSFGLGTRTVIGRSADCDLRIEGQNIAPQHVEISLEKNGELILRQLDQQFETRVNGIPVERTSLASGDEISVGSYRWVLQAPGLRPAKVLTADAVKPRRGYLRWLIIVALLAFIALAWQRGWLSF
jgi:predicted component of type VI protein secretion system